MRLLFLLFNCLLENKKTQVTHLLIVWSLEALSGPIDGLGPCWDHTLKLLVVWGLVRTKICSELYHVIFSVLAPTGMCVWCQG